MKQDISSPKSLDSDNDLMINKIQAQHKLINSPVWINQSRVEVSFTYPHLWRKNRCKEVNR